MLGPVLNEAIKHVLVLDQIPLHHQNQQFAARMQSISMGLTEWIGEELQVLPVQEHFMEEVLSLQKLVLQ